MDIKTAFFEKAILVGSSKLLNKIQQSECPIWQFHYLGAISAYCDMAQNLKSETGRKVHQELLDLENKALAEISYKSRQPRQHH
tara:strand:+ start:94554 stop:94805 length:252 start_codon:yes stop_codon:yes gene_type:complete